MYLMPGSILWVLIHVKLAIQHFPASALSYMGRFVSGTLNWLAKDNASSSSVIVSLDLGTETYKQLLLPNCRANATKFTLEVLKGSLCILAHCNLFTDVWVMKDYGNRESWTKLLVVPDLREYPQFFNFFPYLKITRALFISDEDDKILLELLLNLECKLVVYNYKKGSFRAVEIQNLIGHIVTEVYAESLISPYF